MTTKGNKQTVATIARRMDKLEKDTLDVLKKMREEGSKERLTIAKKMAEELVGKESELDRKIQNLRSRFENCEKRLTGYVNLPPWVRWWRGMRGKLV